MKMKLRNLLIIGGFLLIIGIAFLLYFDVIKLQIEEGKYKNNPEYNKVEIEASCSSGNNLYISKDKTKLVYPYLSEGRIYYFERNTEEELFHSVKGFSGMFIELKDLTITVYTLDENNEKVVLVNACELK